MNEWVKEHLPAVAQLDLAGLALWQWIALVIAIAIAWPAGVLLAGISLRLARRAVERTKVSWDDELLETLRPPTRFTFSLLLFRGLAHLADLDPSHSHFVSVLWSILLVVAGAWYARRLVTFSAGVIEARARIGDTNDPGRLRGVRTQLLVVRRVLGIAIVVVAIALVLMQFEVVRTLGLSLLASAGIAGVVLGLAAQRTVGSLLSGIQLSVTQPVRIGDRVIVEGEFGTIEEVNLTYVVVKIWDERRLVVPVTRFLEQPFQNWTRTSTEMLGTVELYADYTVPVDKMREELDRCLDGNELWDERSKAVLVTELSERTAKLRITVSASDASKLWDLRCQVRERMLVTLQKLDGGRYLPRTRVDAEGERARETASA